MFESNISLRQQLLLTFLASGATVVSVSLPASVAGAGVVVVVVVVVVI